MNTVASLLSTLSGWVWGPPMLVFFVLTGLLLTFRLRGLQFWALPHMLRLIFRKDPNGEGEVSHFQALTTALSATVGIGNIVGIAMAVKMGGPGAVFWLFVMGWVGIATKYSEAVLAVKYRVNDATGYRGGPMYYLTRGLKAPWLGLLFAIFTAVACFGIGNMTQANATAKVFQSTFSIDPRWTGIVLAVLTGAVILGGIKSIGKVTSIIVPLKVGLYFLGCLTVIFVHWSRVPQAIHLVLVHAFTPMAAVGGFAGATVAAAIRFGIARGVFANEAGLGSAPIAAAAARTNDPVTQALVSGSQVFIDSCCVCMMTALVVLTSNAWTQGLPADQLTAAAFGEVFGKAGIIFIALATASFAYSTLVGWNYYGESAIVYLFGGKALLPYRLLFCVLVFVGATAKLETVWAFSDVANGLMAIPNLIALFLLSGVVQKETQRYFAQRKAARDTLAATAPYGE